MTNTLDRIPQYDWWPTGVPIADVATHDCRYCKELHARLITEEDIGRSADRQNATLEAFNQASA